MKETSKPSLIEALEEVNIDSNNPKRITFIMAELEPEERVSLIKFFREHREQYAWSHRDMIGITLKSLPTQFESTLHTNWSRKREGYSLMKKCEPSIVKSRNC